MTAKISKFLRSFFKTNPSAKVLAFLITAFLWMFVAGTQSTIGKYPGQIPLKSVNIPNGLVAIYDQKDVEIEISAEPSIWHKLTESSFSAYLDLSDVRVGTYELDVKVISNVSDVKVLTVKPSKVFVRVEEVVKKTVPINSRIEGSAAEGLIASSINFVPGETEITGPKSVIERVTEAVAIIRLSGESADFTRDIQLRAYSDDGKELQDVSFNPSRVRANVTITRGSNNKTLGIKANLIGNPGDGFYVSKISVNPSTINVTGPTKTLDNLNYLETQNIEISNATTVLEKEVSIRVPEGVSLQPGEPTRVKVTVTLAESLVSKTVTPQVQFKNLSDSLRLSLYSPNDIKVTVSGKQSIMKSLSGSDLILEIDLSGKDAGNFNIDISNSMVRSPEGVTILDVVPSSLLVTLNKK